MIRSALLLALAASSGAAQGGQSGAPPPVTRVEDLPPEIRAVLPPGAILSGPPVSDGDAVFDAPRPVGAPVLPESVPLIEDAVIAGETLRLLPFHSRLAGPLAVGPPFNVRHPAGTDVPRLVKDGTIRNCLRQRGTFTPPQDEHGEVYPGLCLEDRDGDGGYETAILLPYHEQRAQPRTVRIAPVRLAPNPADAGADPDGRTVQRRIRVTHVGADEVQIVVEQGIAVSRRREITSYYSRPEDSLTLPLREGAAGSLAGVALRLVRDGNGWRVAATGRLSPWLEVRDNGDLIVAGGMEFQRHPVP